MIGSKKISILLNKKYLLVFPVLAVIAFFTTSTVFAAPEDVHSGNYKAAEHANFTFRNLLHSAVCELAGMSPEGRCVGTTIEGNQKKIVLLDQQPGGAIGFLGGGMVAMYTNPPTSSTTYLAHLGESFGIAPAYAQTTVTGSGSGIIRPVLEIWQVSRNIALIMFVLVFLVIGFMIMFRQRLNPQTVVGVQAALPGLVIGLVLVYFSYFIAAFLVDLSFLGLQLVSQLFIQIINDGGVRNALGDANQIQNLARSSNIFELFSTAALRLNFGSIVEYGRGFTDLIFSGSGSAALITSILLGILGAMVGFIAGPWGAAIGLGIGAIGGPTLGVFVIPIFIVLILIIALFIQCLRLVWQLINSYIQILLSTAFGPFIILFASIPGRGGLLTYWWKNILANALVFPAVFAAFLFAGLILGTTPESWNVTLPLFGGISSSIIRVIIAFGIILSTPAIPDTIRKLFQVSGPDALAQAAYYGAAAGFGVERTGVSKGLIEPAQAEYSAWREAVFRKRFTPGGAAAGDIEPPRNFLANLMWRGRGGR